MGESQIVGVHLPQRGEGQYGASDRGQNRPARRIRGLLGFAAQRHYGHCRDPDRCELETAHEPYGEAGADQTKRTGFGHDVFAKCGPPFAMRSLVTDRSLPDRINRDALANRRQRAYQRVDALLRCRKRAAGRRPYEQRLVLVAEVHHLVATASDEIEEDRSGRIAGQVQLVHEQVHDRRRFVAQRERFGALGRSTWPNDQSADQCNCQHHQKQCGAEQFESTSGVRIHRSVEPSRCNRHFVTIPTSTNQPHP